MRSQCFQDGADSQYSLPGTCRVFFVFFFFNHYIELCFQRYIVKILKQFV